MSMGHWSRIGIRIDAIVTTAQFEELIKLKFDPVTENVSLDGVIDWLRRKHNIIIYNSIEPFVDPVSDNHHILYRFSVKHCNLRDGWNGREYIGESKLTKNIYTAKKQAITLAIKWLKQHRHERKKKI